MNMTSVFPSKMHEGKPYSLPTGKILDPDYQI